MYHTYRVGIIWGINLYCDSIKTRQDKGSGGCRIRGGSAHLEGGIVEVKTVGFGDYKAKLLEGVFTWGWGCVRVSIESLWSITLPANGGSWDGRNSDKGERMISGTLR